MVKDSGKRRITRNTTKKCILTSLNHIPMTLQKLQEEYFEKLSDELERLYPKGISKERSTALAFNSFANMFARESIQCAYEAGRDDERARVLGIVISKADEAQEKQFEIAYHLRAIASEIERGEI